MRMRKLLLTSVCAVAIAAATVAVASGCAQDAEQVFLFSAEQFYNGTTYKLNLSGMSDGSCTLNCVQASPQLALEGSYEFTEGKGYSFDFDGQTLQSGYNDATQEHYLIYDLAMTSSYDHTMLMTYKDADFTPGAGYVDPYEAAADMVYETLSPEEGGIEGDEVFKLLDNGDSFYLFSYGEEGLFYYGDVKDEGGTKTYVTYDGETEMERVESDIVSGAYYVSYPTSSGPFSTKQNYMFYLNGSTFEEAFPDLELSGGGGGFPGGFPGGPGGGDFPPPPFSASEEAAEDIVL